MREKIIRFYIIIRIIKNLEIRFNWSQKQKILKSNFRYLDTLRVLKLPKIWDLYGTIRQIIFEERIKYDASEQIKIFFEINEKENLKNIDFDGFDVSKFIKQ